MWIKSIKKQTTQTNQQTTQTQTKKQKQKQKHRETGDRNIRRLKGGYFQLIEWELAVRSEGSDGFYLIVSKFKYYGKQKRERERERERKKEERLLIWK